MRVTCKQFTGRQLCVMSVITNVNVCPVRTNVYFVFERKYNYEAKLLAAISLSDFSYTHSHR